MNALGVEIENRLGKSIMSGLHGMWSAGALIGAAGGTLAAHLGSDARLHHALAAGAPDGPGARRLPLGAGPAPDRGRGAAAAVRAAAEVGAAHRRDRLLRGVRRGREPGLVGGLPAGRAGTSAGLAAASTTGFMLTMALARLVGDAVVNRFGAVRTVRAGGALAVLGGLLSSSRSIPPWR